MDFNKLLHQDPDITLSDFVYEINTLKERVKELESKKAINISTFLTEEQIKDLIEGIKNHGRKN